LLDAKAQLRKQLRSARRQIKAKQRLYLSQQATARFVRQRFFLKARSIALYAPLKDEVATSYLADIARLYNKRCFLPVLHPFAGNRLLFSLWTMDTKLTANRFGILEPQPLGVLHRPQQFDLIVVPLLGFDKHGARLGMGGGYYDRTFAFRLSRKTWCRPLLVGLAFACQEVTHVPRDAWDLQLDYVVTNDTVYRC
jgi:5-formyltetrahydrofolate cyclo-ligase